MIDVEKYGITIERSAATEVVWRAVSVRKLSGAENRGGHHIYVNAINERGERVQPASVKANEFFFALDKPDGPLEKGHGNIPMWWGTTYDVMMVGHPSDSVRGFHTMHEDEESGNTRGHHSFAVTFQLTRGEPIEGHEEPPTDWELRVVEIDKELSRLQEWAKNIGYRA